MPKSVQIMSQFRFNDGDKAKKPYKWQPIPMDADGNVEDGTYESTCLSTGAQKANDYKTISLPDTIEEITSDIPEEVVVTLVGESLIARAKKVQAGELREGYESPQQAANRQKREEAAYKEYLGDKMVAFTDANPGTMPDAEMFKTWQEEATVESKK